MASKFSVLFTRSPAITTVMINLPLALLWGLSLMLGQNGLWYGEVLMGTLALFAPGVCWTLILEQLSETPIRPILFSLWTALFTFILTPAAVYGISLGLYKQAPINQPIPSFVLWWAISFVFATVIGVIKRRPTVFHALTKSGDRPPQAEKSLPKELGLIVLGYIIILTANFMLYPLLPEGDSYLLLVKWRLIEANPQLLLAETRTIFLILINLWSHLTSLELYWILKLFLPLSHITIVLSCYLVARKYIANSWYRVVASLSPLLFPVILQEILISRPQSIFLLFFIPGLVIISEVLTESKNRPIQNFRHVYWLFTLLILFTLGIKIHTLFAVMVMICLVSILLFLKEKIKENPLDALLIGLALFALIFPQLISSRLIPDVRRLFQIFIEAIKQSHFDLWFIDHYRNVDGIEVGWPGPLSLFYYGYNLGFAFVILLIWLLLQKKGRALTHFFKREYWGVTFLLVFFFFIAEIAPRFGVAYLPDRAWLFLAFLFCFLIPPILGELSKNNQRYVPWFIGIVCLASVLAGSALTYAKQGWVTPDEVKAAQYIKNNTPENAVIFGPGSMRVMVRYYGRREYVHAPADIFLTAQKNALDSYLAKQQSMYDRAVAAIPEARAGLSTRLSEIASGLINPELPDAQLKQFLDSLSIFTQQEDRYFLDSTKLEELKVTQRRPVYLVYNQNKFNSLYGTRSWWRISNYYGTDVDRLSKTYPVVYNKDGIMLWEAKK